MSINKTLDKFEAFNYKQVDNLTNIPYQKSIIKDVTNYESFKAAS